MTEEIKRWRGLAALIGAAVEQGASAVERVHLATARRPFGVLERIPGIAAPATAVDAIHHGVVTGVYESVRVVTRVVTKTLDVALEAIDDD